jgi:rod shape-determining protein MreD
LSKTPPERWLAALAQKTEKVTFVLPGGTTINLYLTLPFLTSIALLQTTLLAQVNLWGGQPDLMLLVVLIWTVLRGTEEGALWGLIGGLIIDLLSGGPLPATVLALLPAVILVGQSLGRGIGSFVVRLMLLIFLGVLAYHLVLLIVLGWTGHPVDWGFSLLHVAGPSALLNMLLAPFVQQPLVGMERATREEGFVV